MAVAPDNQIINYLVRMVVPMRREFGRSLDVAQFFKDSDYAVAVLEQALTSQDPRLRDYASHVKERLTSARVAAAPLASPVAKPTTPEPPADELNEAALRARVMRKYTGGLR